MEMFYEIYVDLVKIMSLIQTPNSLKSCNCGNYPVQILTLNFLHRPPQPS